jgi:hypothetical protein
MTQDTILNSAKSLSNLSIKVLNLLLRPIDLCLLHKCQDFTWTPGISMCLHTDTNGTLDSKCFM